MTLNLRALPHFVYLLSPSGGGGGGLVAKSCPTLATPWTIALQAPLSIGFSRQEYWSGLPFPSPGDLPNPGIKARSPALQADSLPTELQGKPSGINYLITYFGPLLCPYRKENQPISMMATLHVRGTFCMSGPWVTIEHFLYAKFCSKNCVYSFNPQSNPVQITVEKNSAEETEAQKC